MLIENPATFAEILHKESRSEEETHHRGEEMDCRLFKFLFCKQIC